MIPFALPEAIVRKTEAISVKSGPVVQLNPLGQHTVTLILSSSPFVKMRMIHYFVPALRDRIESLGSKLNLVDFIPLEDETGEIVLAETIQERVAEGAEIIILTGETAIMDCFDITPRAVERSGDKVICYGAPVDPDNLLMLAYLNEIPILGAPGCAHSRKTNVIDWILPLLLAGDRRSRKDIIHMGQGGLFADISISPMPRE